MPFNKKKLVGTLQLETIAVKILNHQSFHYSCIMPFNKKKLVGTLQLETIAEKILDHQSFHSFIMPFNNLEGRQDNK